MASGNPDELADHRWQSRAGEHKSARRLPDQQRQPAALQDLPSAVVHLYRAEVGRAVSWRQRLDVTTNWAVVTTAAGMTFALGNIDAQRHVVILLTSILITFFLLFEARRYRHYHLWQTRVHLPESEVYASLLDPERFPPDPAWQTALAANLRYPRYEISFLEAIGWRLRRNYLWLYITHLLVWFVKVSIHPEPITNLEQLVTRAMVGPLSGLVMLVIGIVFNCILVVLTLLTTRHLEPGGAITRF